MNPILRKINDWQYNNAIRKKLPIPTDFEQTLIDALRNDLSNIKQVFNANSRWEEYQKQTIRFLMENDPRRFLSSKVIIDTMFFQGSSTAVNQLINSSDFSYWKPLVKEDAIGSPKPFFKYKESSGNLLQHCISLKQVLNKANIKPSDLDSVFEFGGGYGSFCRLLHKAGFNNRYVIFDLPIFSALQKYYLSNLSIKSGLTETAGNIGDHVSLINDIAVLKGHKDEVSKSGLFVALWSLSECPVDLRKDIFSIVDSPKYVLIGYQHHFSGIDNLTYFDGLKQQMGHYTWYDEPIAYIPGNNYLVGIRNEPV
jgi:putative sugar O-methyltransferase